MSRLWARCGSLGKAVGLVSARANTAATNAHPVAIGAAVAPGSVGVVAPDGAGRRKSRKLALPDNIVLLALPPYSTELNSMETVFPYPGNNRLANRVFADIAAVAVAVAVACREA